MSIQFDLFTDLMELYCNEVYQYSADNTDIFSLVTNDSAEHLAVFIQPDRIILLENESKAVSYERIFGIPAFIVLKQDHLTYDLQISTSAWFRPAQMACC